MRIVSRLPPLLLEGEDRRSYSQVLAVPRDEMEVETVEAYRKPGWAG